MAVFDQIFIAGAWQPASGKSLALINPDTEAQEAQLVCASPDQCAEAVAAARRAFDAGWGQSDLATRRAALERVITQIEARAEKLAQTISTEIGAPIDFARKGQVAAGLAHLRATLGALDGLVEDRPLTSHPEHRLRYEPLGVAALITPWNWPLNQVALKLGGALAAGCCMVLKPSELSSRTALVLAEAMAAADLPPGVFNLITGAGDIGAALVQNRDVDIVSFTGSTRTGRFIAAEAAQNMTRTVLELGGKSPNILFEDCDLPLAITQGLAHCFRNAGQSCNAASRMLVARDIYERAIALATEGAAQTRVDRPAQPGAHIGPQINWQQYARVQGYMSQGIAEGARLIAGGPGRPDHLDHGFYSRPTVFADVTPDMAIFTDEIFGPVLTMTPFDSEEEAIALANQTEYGLAGYIQTADPARADRVARALRVGMVQINGQSRENGAPFGGRGLSGYGREAGVFGIRAFQDAKSISGAALQL
ncbi:aldehyde dehydrogenase family protein [Tropicibacter sp. R15_0]|uniref:aldehyde dehydrogenase family protein n=1 Tax=Tropicibacter sp. R15_0 TaxID=2821101 RepID=UPI001AD9D874|nr:aldehyde dehydrogenase family protein [Tropicibacter sp. R15_0]MBO9465339.1 aldehyde dehydrogenase family protein [Tropicibacter sp. R15_0]